MGTRISFLLFVILFVPSLSNFSKADNLQICDPKTFGAKGDGKTKDTGAIQAAIDSCAELGGRVDLKNGIFLSGTIRLKSHVDLNIEPSAVLKGSQDDSDYPDLLPPIVNTQLSNCRKALVYAESADGLVIEGGGTINGSGGNPHWRGKEATRPMAIFVAASQNVLIQNLKVLNSGMWSVVNMEVDNLEIRGLLVHSLDGPTRDGIDIVDCHHAVIERNEIASEDDSICLKSGSQKGVYDVTVRDNVIHQSSVANGLKLGTASSGFFKKVLFQNIQMENVKQAAMAVESVDGGAIDDIRFENIRFTQTGSAIYVILGRRGVGPTGSVKNISFLNIVGSTNRSWGSAISGTQNANSIHEIENVTIKDYKVSNSAGLHAFPADPPEYSGQYPDPRLWGDLPAYGLFLRHIRGLNTANVQVLNTKEMRPQLVFRDVEDIIRR